MVSPVNWRDQGDCRHYPELDWFKNNTTGLAWSNSTTASNQRYRKLMEVEINICQACPVQAPCADWAIRSRQDCGIWGGLTSYEIGRLARGNHSRALLNELASTRAVKV